jgi:hypothetical protein
LVQISLRNKGVLKHFKDWLSLNFRELTIPKQRHIIVKLKCAVNAKVVVNPLSFFPFTIILLYSMPYLPLTMAKASFHQQVPTKANFTGQQHKRGGGPYPASSHTCNLFAQMY